MGASIRLLYFARKSKPLISSIITSRIIRSYLPSTSGFTDFARGAVSTSYSFSKVSLRSFSKSLSSSIIRSLISFLHLSSAVPIIIPKTKQR